MTSIKVANLKHTNKGVRCDRGTALGNPFELTHESERDNVIFGFKRYLWMVLHHNIEPYIAANDIANDQNLKISRTWKRPSRDDIESLLTEIIGLYEKENVTLLCWCFPKKCHCDVIKAYIEWLVSQS